jgi:signal transduction histidine kinase
VVAVVTASSIGLGLVDGVVPQWAAWVLIWFIATTGPGPRAGAARSASVAVCTVGALLLGALAQGDAGALVILIAVTVVVALVAVLVRTERGRLEALRRRATIEERLRIARDLHDLVGHGLSVVSVQSGTARLALEAGQPEVARRALTAIESSSRTALGELRQMLGVLRGDVTGPDGEGASQQAGSPAPGVADITRLVDDVRAGGVEVALEESGDWESQPAGLQLCAYRIVQEGLTNAVRHAPGAAVSITLETSGATDATSAAGPLADTGVVAVRTSASALATTRTDGDSGLGLSGLRARVAALGGEFHSGPTADGWLIRARLPLETGRGDR